MVEPRFAHLRDTREIRQGDLWLTRGSPTFSGPRPELSPGQPRVVIILSPDDVNNDPDSLDIRVAPLSERVEQASELDLRLDLSQDVRFDNPEDQDGLAQRQIIELWNDQGTLKVNLDRRLGRCSELVQDQIKQVLRWSYGVELCQEAPAWVGRLITEQTDPRLRFQDQEREATRFLREPVEQLYRLLAEAEETEEEIMLDEEEVQDIAAFEAWQGELLRENQARDEYLSRFLRESLRLEDLAVLRGPCPDTPTFVAYQQGDLPIEEAGKIQQHVAFCRPCLEEIVALGRADEIDYDPERDYTAVALPRQLRQELFGRVPEPVGETVIDRAVKWLSELWQPPWVGEPVTATDIPEQEHVFRMEDGEIKISCSWRSQYNENPAYVWVKWRADISTPDELWARFTRPETETVLAEVRLGPYLEGEETFTSDYLGFDPSAEKWAISLILTEVES